MIKRPGILQNQMLSLYKRLICAHGTSVYLALSRSHAQSGHKISQDQSRSPRWNKDIKELKMLGSALASAKIRLLMDGSFGLFGRQGNGACHCHCSMADRKGSRQSEAWNPNPKCPKCPEDTRGILCRDSSCQVDKKDIKLFCTYCSFRQLSKPSICLPEVT